MAVENRRGIVAIVALAHLSSSSSCEIGTDAADLRISAVWRLARYCATVLLGRVVGLIGGFGSAETSFIAASMASPSFSRCLAASFR